MTTNGAIALVLAGIVAVYGCIGLVLLWQARAGLWRNRRPVWPVSVLVALSGPFLAVSLVGGQLVLFRMGSVPAPFTPNGLGTLGVRVACFLIGVAFLTRLLRRRLLNGDDRARINSG